MGSDIRSKSTGKVAAEKTAPSMATLDDVIHPKHGDEEEVAETTIEVPKTPVPLERAMGGGGG